MPYFGLVSNDFVALQSGDTEYKFDYLNQLIQDIGMQFRDKYNSDQKFALLVDNPIDFVPIYLGIIWAEKTAVPLNTRLTEQNLLEQLNSIDCNFVITDNKYSSYFADEMITKINVSDLINSGFKYHEQDGMRITNSCDNSAIGSIIFTSGSSGISKAVAHNVSASMYSAKGAVKQLQLENGDKWLLTLPLYHVGGLAIIQRCLMSGARAIVADNPGNPLNDIVKYKPTHLSLVPTQLQRIIDSIQNTENNSDIQEAVSGIKAILIGGAACPEELKRKAKELDLPVYYSYGSTEMSSLITLTDSESPMNSSGKVLEYRAIKIAASGEILVKGETLCLGYLQKDSQSGKVKLIPQTDSEGYFHTSDIGEITQSGDLIVKGRLDNMFISGGENIYPEEIEQALAEIPNIEFAVISPIEHNEYGYVPIALIKWKNERTLPIVEIKNILRSKIAGYKIPNQFIHIPKDYVQTGIKPNRQELLKLLK